MLPPPDDLSTTPVQATSPRAEPYVPDSGLGDIDGDSDDTDLF